MIKIKTIHDYEYLPFVDDRLLFRGQSKECYRLLPGAYRSNDDPKNKVLDFTPKIEINSIERFIYHLLERGYSFKPKENLQEIFNSFSPIFPGDDILPYMALAQHYASDSEFHWLRTSLLDVSYSLDIATYFAVNKDFECNGKIYVFNKDQVNEKPPYKVFELYSGMQNEARMVVQNGAFIYRQQIYDNYSEMPRYNDFTPFDDNIVLDTIIIPRLLKEDLKEHLRRKLFDNLILPKLLLGKMTLSMPSFGNRSNEELLKIHKPAIDMAENASDIHSCY